MEKTWKRRPLFCQKKAQNSYNTYIRIKDTAYISKIGKK